MPVYDRSCVSRWHVSSYGHRCEIMKMTCDIATLHFRHILVSGINSQLFQGGSGDFNGGRSRSSWSCQQNVQRTLSDNCHWNLLLQ